MLRISGRRKARHRPLSAKSQRGAQQVAAFWQSNGAVAATEQICVSVRASQLNLKGGGSLSGSLVLSYNGAVQSVTSSVIDRPNNDVEFCAPVASGARITGSVVIRPPAVRSS